LDSGATRHRPFLLVGRPPDAATLHLVTCFSLASFAVLEAFSPVKGLRDGYLFDSRVRIDSRSLFRLVTSGQFRGLPLPLPLVPRQVLSIVFARKIASGIALKRS
jgi:hypothetical protein